MRWLLLTASLFAFLLAAAPASAETPTPEPTVVVVLVTPTPEAVATPVDEVSQRLDYYFPALLGAQFFFGLLVAGLLAFVFVRFRQ